MPITEEILRKRLQNADGGSILPQVFVTSAASIGAFIFGSIIGWGCPAARHLHEMKVNDYRTNYAWTVTIAPLAGAFGIFPWAFFSKRLGPKKTMIMQTPFNLLFWYLISRFQNLHCYNVSRFFTAFFSVSYSHCGEELLIGAVHRKYMKVMYAFFRTALFLGVLTMNIMGPIMGKRWLCVIFGCCITVTCLCYLYLPESPVYLMFHNPVEAKKSLEWYRGNHPVTAELDVMAQYVSLQKYNSGNFIFMLRTKVVMKGIKICLVLFVLKAMCGYYSFVMDSSSWFTPDISCVNPYTDNIIFSTIMMVARFCGMITHLYAPFGNRKPLLISTFSLAFLLALLGYCKFMLQFYLTDMKEKCIVLPTLCLYTVAYECALSICPEITLYDYLPFQVYDFVKRIMQMTMWLMIFVVARIYMETMQMFHIYITLWILALNMFIGYIYLLFFLVDTKKKHLMTIQLELGGNPVGTRGSRRQRIATPMEHIDTNRELRELIRKSNQNQQTEP